MRHITFTHKLFALAVVAALTLGQQSFAQRIGSSGGADSGNHIYFEETFFPVFVSKNDAASPAGGASDKSVPKESGFGYDARTTLGYVWNSVLMGLTYNMYSVSSTRPLTADYEGLSTSTERQEFGPTLGYFLGSWRFALTYFMSATKTVNQKYTDPVSGAVSTDETYKNSGGSGFQFSFGYDFALGAGFGISPTLVYRAVSYSKQSYTVRTGSGTPYGSTSLQTKAIDDELNPMITISYRF